MMDTAKILAAMRPGAEFSVLPREDGSVEIVWHDSSQTQPTQAEIDAFAGAWSPPPPRIISGNDLVRRFLAINPAAVVAIEHSQVPEIIIGRKLAETAREGIDLDSPETAYYMGLLVLEGIITEAERSQILNPEED